MVPVNLVNIQFPSTNRRVFRPPNFTPMCKIQKDWDLYVHLGSNFANICQVFLTRIYSSRVQRDLRQSQNHAQNAWPCHAAPHAMCCTMPCCTMLHHAMLHHAAPCHAAPCHAMPCHAMLHHGVESFHAAPCMPSQGDYTNIFSIVSFWQCHAMPYHAQSCCAFVWRTAVQVLYIHNISGL